MSKIDMGHRGSGDTARRKEQREKRTREHSRFMVLVACVADLNLFLLVQLTDFISMTSPMSTRTVED